jgi:hypothetical protein
MPFWSFMETGMGIFLTLAILGVILTHSGEFVSLVNSAGSQTAKLFSTMTFQGE